MRVLGAILAGGKAARFGSDKAHALYQGERLIDRVAAALAEQSEEVAVCGREEAGFVCLPDRPSSDIGPLGGLAGALHYAGTEGFTHVLSAPCDTPELPRNLAEALCGITAAICEDQPVIGMWPAGLAGKLDAFIGRGGRSLYGFAEHVKARRITFDPPILNVNRPEDLG